MAESNPDPGMPLPPPQKSHWRAYAAVVAILAALVTVANGVNALVKFPSSAAQLRDWMWPGSASAPIMLTIAKDATKPAPGHGRMDLAGVGDVMGGGADVRLVMQTHDAGKIVQVSKLTAKVTRLNPPACQHSLAWIAIAGEHLDHQLAGIFERLHADPATPLRRIISIGLAWNGTNPNRV